MLGGLVAALVVMAIIYGYVALRPVPPIDVDFGPDKSSFTTPTPVDQTFKVVEGLPVSAKYKLGRADAARGRVILQDGIGLGSYGYFYTVDVKPADTGTVVAVGIKSKYPLQFGPIVRRQRDKARDMLVEALKAKLAAAI